MLGRDLQSRQRSGGPNEGIGGGGEEEVVVVVVEEGIAVSGAGVVVVAGADR